MSVLLHTEDLQKLCRICCQFLGKGSYCKEKHQENIEHIFLINTKNDNPSLHPDKICQKCYCVMSAAIKRKSTITTAAFKNWTEHSVQHCHICDRIQLFQKGVLGTRKFGSKKKSNSRPKAETKDSLWSQSFFDSLALQIKSIIPATVTFKEVNNEDLNPHVSLCICEICSEIIKKPIKILKCEHKFCLNCLMASLRGKTEMESQCPSCKIKISKTDASPSTDLETMLSLLQTQCKLCSKKFKIANHAQYINHTQNCSINDITNCSISDIFSISVAHIPRNIEDAALHALRTKIKSNPKSSTIEFKTGGRVSLDLLINTTLSNSYLIC